MATTKLANLINPEVLGAYLESKLVDEIKLSPLATVGTTLQGRAGDTLTMPSFSYIGDANDLAEGVEDVPVLLEASTKSVTVKKIAKSVEVTDESMLNAHGDVQNEVAKQLLVALASKVEGDLFGELATAPVHNATFGAMAVADALVKFGEDVEGQTYLFINPAQYATIRKDANFYFVNGQEMTIGGHVGYVFNCAVVVSNRVPVGHAYVVREGALAIEMKRNVNAESDRNVLNRTTVFTADQHYIAYLRDESKAIVIKPQA